MNKIDLDDLKQRISLEQLFTKDGVKLVNGTGMKKCLCPFHHEKTPSCCIYPDNHFYCFSCAAGGTVIDYVMKSRNVKFREAVEFLQSGQTVAWRFNQVPLKQFIPNLEPPAPDFDAMLGSWVTSDLMAFGLSEQLGVAKRALLSLGVRWAQPHNAWAFPMRNAEGTTVGIRLRDGNGKKWAVKGSKEGLFYSNPTRDTLFLCEGPTDAAAGLTMGLNIVGRPSCQGAVLETVNLIERLGCREVVIISDNDGPGLDGSARLQRALPVPYRELVLPCKDLREFLKLGGTKALIECMVKSQLVRRS